MLNFKSCIHGLNSNLKEWKISDYLSLFLIQGIVYIFMQMCVQVSHPQVRYPHTLLFFYPCLSLAPSLLPCFEEFHCQLTMFTVEEKGKLIHVTPCKNSNI